MSQQDVRALLESRLSAFAADNGLTVKWENVKFTPPADGSAYLRSDLLPAQGRSEDLAGTLRTWLGVYQITIAIPAGAGPAVAETLLKQLDSTFPCGMLLQGSISVLIASPVSAGNGFTDEAYHLVPASFQYRADVALT